MNGPGTAVAPTAVSGPFLVSLVSPSSPWQESVVAVIGRQERRIVRLDG